MSDEPPPPLEVDEFDPGSSSTSGQVRSEEELPRSESPTLPAGAGERPAPEQETLEVGGRPQDPPCAPLQVEEFTPESSSATLRARPPSTDHRISRIVHTVTPPAGSSNPGALGVDGYSVSDELGRGAQGIVYRATPDGLGPDVAIKILRPEAGEEQLERFERAIDSMEALRDVRGVVQLIGRGRTRLDAPYLAMELVRGPSLRALLNKGRVSPRQLVSMLVQVAYALHQAHDRGIVHRDLKPENILIETSSGEMEARVADFGLARDLTQAVPRSTAGGLGGTPVYMAPEQVLGEPITRRTDIHALGTILYEIIMGAPPFRSQNVATTVHVIATQRPRRPRVRWTRLPESLEEITLRALEKNPDDRYPTAAAFAAQIKRALSGAKMGKVPTRRIKLRKPGRIQTQAWAGLRRRALFFKGLAMGVALGAALGVWAGAYW